MIRALIVLAALLQACASPCQWRETDWQPPLAPLDASDSRDHVCYALLASPGSGFHERDPNKCAEPRNCELISVDHSTVWFRSWTGELAYYVDDTTGTAPEPPGIVDDVPCDLSCDEFPRWELTQSSGAVH